MLGRVGRDSCLVLGDGAVEILQSRKGVTTKDLRFRILLVVLEDLVCTCACVLESAGQQQSLRRLDLCVDVRREQVGSPDVFLDGVDRIVGRAYASPSSRCASPLWPSI